MVNKITNPPSQKELIDKVNEIIDDKQDTLVSGTNIKTINNTSILGSGNIDIQGGGSYTAGTGIDITNDVISVTNDISTGAALGATAVQPSALATVAISGSYNDLSNKPTIPSAVTESTVSGWGFTKNTGTVTSVNNVSPVNGNVTLSIPTVPTNVSAFTNDSGYITLSALNGYATKNYVDTSKADIDLSNITSTGKNIANWSTNVSNCITEIPQDIKLELNNGTLTLKAGSKVYIPNGSGKFDEVVIASDLTTSIADNSKHFIFYNLSNNSLWFSSETVTQSGATNPSNLWGFFYNSTDNKVYYLRNNTTPDDLTFSLPIATVISNGTQITSIDQVFNGFGYIGSTVFALPGVKGLIPNGRNEDGTLNNISFMISNVKFRNFTFAVSNLCFRPSNGTFGNLLVSYNETDNLLTTNGTDRWLNIGTLVTNTSSPYNITSFTPKTPFHAVDYNDFSNLKNTVDINDSNVVHKTGNETISGEKTFQGEGWITKIQNTDVTYNTAPSSDKKTAIVFVDKNGTQMGIVECFRSTDNSTTMQLNTYGSNGNWSSQPLQLKVFSDGHTVVYAPASDLNGSIVTTTGINKSPNGYVKLGNGLIIQWGIITVSTSNKYSAVITFPIPFSNTNYSLNITQYTTTNAMIWSTPAVLMFGNKTTTSVKTQSQHTDRLQWIAVGY